MIFPKVIDPIRTPASLEDLTKSPPSLLSRSCCETLHHERVRNKQWIHKTVSRDVSCEMTTRHTLLAAAMVVAQELDGVALDAVHLIAEVALSMDLGVKQCHLCHLQSLPQKTPCTDGASFTCQRPFLGRLTQETRACGFVWRVLTAVTWLARVELLGRSRHCGRYPPSSSCDSGWDEKHKHTKRQCQYSRSGCATVGP